jgi:hypothetical protein
MFWVILVAASTWFGFEVIPFSRVNNLAFLPRLFSGWLFGSMLTGVVLYVTSFVVPLSFIHTLVVAIALAVSAAGLLRAGRRSAAVLSFDLTPSLLFYLLFVAGISLRYLSHVYGDLPASGPHLFAPVYDTEMAFIASVISGCNRRHGFRYVNPLISGEGFHGYAVPLLFTAGCMTLGASYSSASIVISFLNTVATACAVYAFAKRFTKWPTASSMVFMFSGSWAAYIYFRAANRLNPANDLVHQFRSDHESIWYQTFASMLSMSKSSSFSIALGQFSIYWAPSVLSGVFVALIPSVATSLAMFGLFAGIPNSLTTIVPFAVTVLPRLSPFLYMYKPLYREAEMRGTFFAPLVIWFIALGPIFIVLLCFGWKVARAKLRTYLFASLGPFLLLHFFRERADHFQNSLAATCAAFPLFVILFTELLRRFALWPTDPEFRGSAKFFVTATLAFMLFGGYICAYRICASSIPYFTHDDIEVAGWIKENVPPTAVIAGISRVLHPTVLTGRQQFMGDRRLLHRFGIKFAYKIEQVDRLLREESSASWHELGVSFAVEQEGFAANAELRVINESAAYRLAAVGS